MVEREKERDGIAIDSFERKFRQRFLRDEEFHGKG